MGQAKLRGTFEVRKQNAIKENELKEFKLKMAKRALIVDNKGKSKINLLLAAALAIGANNGN